MPLAVHDDEAARDETEQRSRSAGKLLEPAAGAGPMSRGSPRRQRRRSAARRCSRALCPRCRRRRWDWTGKRPLFLSSPGYLFVLRSRDRRGIGLLCLLGRRPRHLRQTCGRGTSPARWPRRRPSRWKMPSLPGRPRAFSSKRHKRSRPPPTRSLPNWMGAAFWKASSAAPRSVLEAQKGMRALGPGGPSQAKSLPGGGDAPPPVCFRLPLPWQGRGLGG